MVKTETWISKEIGKYTIRCIHLDSGARSWLDVEVSLGKQLVMGCPWIVKGQSVELAQVLMQPWEGCQRLSDRWRNAERRVRGAVVVWENIRGVSCHKLAENYFNYGREVKYNFTDKQIAGIWRGYYQQSGLHGSHPSVGGDERDRSVGNKKCCAEHWRRTSWCWIPHSVDSPEQHPVHLCSFCSWS